MVPLRILLAGDPRALAALREIFVSETLVHASDPAQPADVVIHAGLDGAAETIAAAADRLPVIVAADASDEEAAELLERGARDCVPLTAPRRLRAVAYREARAANDRSRDVVLDAEEKYRAVVESMQEAVCVAGVEGRCTLANSAAAKMFGAAVSGAGTFHELTGHVRPDGASCTAADCVLLDALRAGRVLVSEELFRRGDGSLFRAEVAASPIRFERNGAGSVFSFRDVTERASASADLARLAATVAHELDEVLTAILPLADVIEHRLPDERLRRAAEGVRQSVVRGRRVTEQILRCAQRADADARGNGHGRAAEVRTILLIEDDESVAEGLTALLTLGGFRVETIDRGAAAEQAVEQVHPDVVVLDLGLPDVGGTEVYSRLAARWPELPVIFVTGHADVPMLDSLLARRGVGVVTKPFELDALVEKIVAVTSQMNG